MKVLLIDVNCKYSSTGKIVYDLFQGLKREKYDASICYGRGKLIQEDNIFKFGLDWETNIHALLARITGLNGYFSYFSTRRLISYINEYKPDVIHIHELHAYFVNIKMLLKYIKKKEIKLVWTFHCEYMYTGKCGHANDCKNFLYNCGSCPSIKSYPKSIFFDFTRKMFNDKKRVLSDMNFTIITPSNWLKERVGISFLKEKDIRIINNGIDCQNTFYIRPIEEQNEIRKKYNILNKKIVLSVAPQILSEEKGGQVVLNLSNKFNDNPTVHFVLIGAEHDEKYSDNVTILKKTNNQEELAIWYSLADLFLICSKKENFPTTCLESLCCGTPIVGLDAGGTKETAEFPFGIFVKSFKDLFEVINEKLVKQRYLSEEDVRNYGYNKYSNEIMVKKYIKVYREVYCDNEKNSNHK